jgi:uncharacterized protein (DUF488 family)
MKIYTIGFTQTTAERFFTRLKKSGANRIIDVRLNNVSQLAGFAKRDDLKYFSGEICGMGYAHLPELAPTKNMLDKFKKNKGDWLEYEQEFLGLMRDRKVESIAPSLLDGGCLLCSEATPHHCHRRLVAEYLGNYWPELEVVHL